MSVDVIDGAGAKKTVAMLKNSSVHSTIRATVLDRDAALKAFHVGKYDLAIESNPDGSYTYYYDPARPQSLLSRPAIDAAPQSPAGRKDAVPTSSKHSREPDSRAIHLLIP